MTAKLNGRSKIVSISITERMHDEMKRDAKTLGLSISEFVRKMYTDWDSKK